uniref:Bulb-type lectin domain-containing protein n=1 Tax=Quercus lobata TaxID=97700 RepID=A0A7N2R5P4_QUELO
MGFLSKSNLFVLCCLCLNFGVAVDTIRSSQSIKDTDSDYIISNGSTFKLGFFSPVNSTNRYLGIWYNRISVFTVVWVANREKPLKDYSGVLTISEDGNLVVLNGQMEILWSSNVTNSVVNPSAQLLDLGNLVLRDNTRTTIWEGFQFPTNTMLPKMKISANARTGKKVQLTSWKSPSDPSIGSFSSGFDPLNIGLPQSFIWKDRSPYWRSGQWNGRIFIGVPNMDSAFRNGFSIETDEKGTISLSFSYVTESLIHLVHNSNGNLEQRSWDDKKKDWVVVLKALQSKSVWRTVLV